MVLLVAPVLAATLALGSLAVPGAFAAPGVAPLADPVPIALPVSVQLSLIASPAYAETSTQVQAVVMTRLGSGPAGTVNFSVEGSSASVGSTVNTATHTAIATIGLFTTGPITVDANFVPSGGSTVTASATQKFQIVGMPANLLVFVPSTAASGSTVPLSVTINTEGQPYPADGHLDVFVDSSGTRAGYCVPAPNPLALGYPCKGTIPAPAAGTHTLHLVLNDSPYYAGSASAPLVVSAPAAAAAAPSTAKSGGGGTGS
ncbi:MAG: hypothetical protein M3N46_03050, partial [Actinomycetota bacterium]|nr:hypothetical protein [Actinomycetota bacterium]